jgi:hypothetical protein
MDDSPDRMTRNWIGIAGLVVGGIALAAMLNNHTSIFGALYRLFVGWTFIAVGLALWEGVGSVKRMGLLLLAVGFAWFIGDYFGTHVPAIVAVAYWFQDLFRVFLAQAGLSYPSGRLGRGAARLVVGAGYVFILVFGLIRTLTYAPYLYENCECPHNALAFIHNKGLFDALDNIYGILGAVLEIIIIVLLVRLFLRSDPAERERSLPWLATAGAFAVLVAIDVLTKSIDVSDNVADWLYFVVSVSLILSALSFLRARQTREMTMTAQPTDVS